MTALIADRLTDFKEGVELNYPVAGSSKLYAGGMVCTNSSGYAIPGADTAGVVFLGVSMSQKDNSSGSNGDLNATVRKKGTFKFACSGMAITDIGKPVYVSDDQTVALISGVTNAIPCGRIAGYVSATEVWVDIDVDHLEPEKVIMSFPISLVANVTTVNGGVAVGRAMRIKRISLCVFAVPVDADGVCTLAVHNYDASANADDNLLSAATFNLETGITVVKEAQDLTLTAVTADLVLAAGDYIHAELVNDSAAIDTAMQGGVLTVEAELL